MNPSGAAPRAAPRPPVAGRASRTGGAGCRLTTACASPSPAGLRHVDLRTLVGNPNRERNRNSHGAGVFCGDRARRSREYLAGRLELQLRRRVLVRGILERLDDVVGVRVEGDRVGEAVGDDRPAQFLGPEILRQLDREHAPLPPGIEVRRLPLIGRAGLDAIVRAGGNVELLLRVAVEVADQDVLRAVLVEVPAFKGRRHAGSALANRRGERQRARRLADARLLRVHERRAGRARQQQTHTGEVTNLHPRDSLDTKKKRRPNPDGALKR